MTTTTIYLQIQIIEGACPANSHKASRGGTRRAREHNGKKITVNYKHAGNGKTLKLHIITQI